MTDLFNPPTAAQAHELAPRSRATDPATSKAAAERFRGKPCASHYLSIMGVLWRPMIPTEIAKFTGLTVVQVDRRRKELIERGDIALTGVVRDGYQEWRKVTDPERIAALCRCVVEQSQPAKG